MHREKIEDVLLKMGVPAGVKGFDYISDAVEYIEEHGERISATKELYPDIAKKHGDTPSKVERAIRHAFDVARSPKGDYDVVEKYIGFMNCSNFHSIMMLHRKIKQDCEKKNECFQKEEKGTGKGIGLTELEIREIFRQEVRNMLDELIGDVT